MIAGFLQQWVEEAPALIGSIIAVSFMVGVAALLGFRQTARIDDAELQRLAATEGQRIDAALIAPDAKSALARLDNGKLMVVRVMGADISARITPAAGARVRIANGKLSVAFADTGFPPLHMKLQHTPPWIAELGEAT